MRRSLRKIALVSSLTIATLGGLAITGCISPGAHEGNSIGLKPGSTFSTLVIYGGAQSGPSAK